MILALIWLPWSGKWTIAKRLNQEFDFAVFMPGAQFRKLAQNDPQLHQIITNGKLVPPSIAQKVLKDFLNQHQNQNIVLDWYPRDLQQKQILDQITTNWQGLYLQIDQSTAIQRVKQRIAQNQQKQRADDNLRTLQKRFDVFKTQTIPLIQTLKQQNKLTIINADKPLEEVKNSVLQFLNNKIWKF